MPDKPSFCYGTTTCCKLWKVPLPSVLYFPAAFGRQATSNVLLLIILHYIPRKEEKEAQIHKLLIPVIVDLPDYKTDAVHEALCQPSTDQCHTGSLWNSHRTETARCLHQPVWTHNMAWTTIPQLQHASCTALVRVMLSLVKDSLGALLPDCPAASCIACICYLQHGRN